MDSATNRGKMASFGFASGDELEQMYQEVILEASKAPHGKTSFGKGQNSTIGSIATATGEGVTTLHASHEGCEIGQSHQFNPTCGDEVTVRVELKQTIAHDPNTHGSPVIEHLMWDGQGCSISQASLSIMVDLIEGKTVDEAMSIFHDFHALMNSRGAGVSDKVAERLEDAIVFQGVSRYPMRIKCALLGWEGFKDSAAQAMAQLQ